MWFVCVCVLDCGLASELWTCMRRQYFTELQRCWLTRTNSIYLMKNEGFSVRCECPKTTSLSTSYLVLLPSRAEFMAISANARMWNYRFIHRRCQIYFLFYLYERERAVTRFSCFNEFMPGLSVFFLSWNTLFSLQLYGLLFFATSFDLIVETQIVWLFVQCCNQFDVTSKSELSLAHSTARTKILQKTSNKEIQSFTSVNLFGFLSYVSNTIN